MASTTNKMTFSGFLGVSTGIGVEEAATAGEEDVAVGSGSVVLPR